MLLLIVFCMTLLFAYRDFVNGHLVFTYFLFTYKDKHFDIFLSVSHGVLYHTIQEPFVLIDRQRGMCIRYTDLL